MTSHDPARERLLIAVTSLGHFLCHLGELTFMGVMLAVKDEFGLDPAHTAVLPMLGFVLMGVGGLPVGVWADWWGPARVLQIYFLAMAVAGCLVALSTNVWTLFASLTLLGLALSVYHPVGLALLATAKAHGRAMGINGVAGSVGVAAGPLLGFVAAALGWWRGAFLVLAGLSLLGAGWMGFAWRRLDSAARLTASTKLPAGVECGLWRRSLPMILLSLSMLLGGFNYRCLVTTLPAYCRSGEEVVLILLLGGCVGQFFGGWAIDRFGSWVYPLFIGLLAPCGLVLAVAQGSPTGTLVATLLAFNLFAQQPVENALLARWTPRGRAGLSYGTKIALTFGFGALGSLVTGLIWDAAGTPAPVFFLFAATATVMVLLVVAALRLRRLLERSAAPPEPALEAAPVA